MTRYRVTAQNDTGRRGDTVEVTADNEAAAKLAALKKWRVTDEQALADRDGIAITDVTEIP